MTDDDSVFDVYNKALMALARDAEDNARLHNAPLTARAVSPICGSEVTLDFTLDQGRITAVGYAVEACALTKAVVTVIKRAAIGKTPDEVIVAGHALAAMLEGGAMPAGDWADLSVLAPVRDYKARHNSVLLPFEVVEKAFKNNP